jgi:hypothetical protein
LTRERVNRVEFVFVTFSSNCTRTSRALVKLTKAVDPFNVYANVS